MGGADTVVGHHVLSHLCCIAPSAGVLVACVRPIFSPAGDCRTEGWSCCNKPYYNFVQLSLVVKADPHVAYTQRSGRVTFPAFPNAYCSSISW